MQARGSASRFSAVKEYLICPPSPADPKGGRRQEKVKSPALLGIQLAPHRNPRALPRRKKRGGAPGPYETPRSRTRRCAISRAFDSQGMEVRGGLHRAEGHTCRALCRAHPAAHDQGSTRLRYQSVAPRTRRVTNARRAGRRRRQAAKAPRDVGRSILLSSQGRNGSSCLTPATTAASSEVPHQYHDARQ